MSASVLDGVGGAQAAGECQAGSVMKILTFSFPKSDYSRTTDFRI